MRLWGHKKSVEKAVGPTPKKIPLRIGDRVWFPPYDYKEDMEKGLIRQIDGDVAIVQDLRYEPLDTAKAIPLSRLVRRLTKDEERQEKEAADQQEVVDFAAQILRETK